MEESKIKDKRSDDSFSKDKSDDDAVDPHRSRDFAKKFKDRSQYNKKGHQVIM